MAGNPRHGPGNAGVVKTERIVLKEAAGPPEQVELLPGVDELDGAVAARVTGYGYHGHDAVVTVQPEAGQAGQDPVTRPLIVRTLGGDALPLGAPVMLRARGPVLAWPDPAPGS